MLHYLSSCINTNSSNNYKCGVSLFQNLGNSAVLLRVFYTTYISIVGQEHLVPGTGSLMFQVNQPKGLSPADAELQIP